MAVGPAPAPVPVPAPPMPPIGVDPGYKTTEFWQSLLTQLVAAVVAIIGMLRQPSGATADQWASAINQITPVVAALLAAFATNRQYVNSRTEVKTVAVQAQAAIAQAAMARAASTPSS